MPQASDQQRDLMVQWFGSMMDDAPVRFLEGRGWTLDASWLWHLPTPAHSVSCYEAECIEFLADEWDYGGTVPTKFKFVCLCGNKDRAHA